ncbi:MAG: hypothetical protein JOZ19_03530 [Rubrobacter sp.]|nr:hypothetical protein [Rubrobacter sp.]
MSIRVRLASSPRGDLGTCREGERLRSRLSYSLYVALLLALWASPLILNLLLTFRRDR